MQSRFTFKVILMIHGSRLIVWCLGLMLLWMGTAPMLSIGQARTARHHLPRKARIPVQPIISSLDPANYEYEMGPDFHYDSVHHGAADNPSSISIAIKGSHFTRKSIVHFNDKPLPTEFISVSLLKATVAMDEIINADTGNDARAKETVVNPATRKGVKPLTSASAPFGISHWAMGG